MALFQVSELLPYIYIIIYHDTFSFSQCYELHPRYPLPMCRQPWIASAHALMRISSRGIRSSWENRPRDTMDHGTYTGWYWVLMDLIYYIIWYVIWYIYIDRYIFNYIYIYYVYYLLIALIHSEKLLLFFCMLISKDLQLKLQDDFDAPQLMNYTNARDRSQLGSVENPGFA